MTVAKGLDNVVNKANASWTVRTDIGTGLAKNDLIKEGGEVDRTEICWQKRALLLTDWTSRKSMNYYFWPAKSQSIVNSCFHSM